MRARLAAVAVLVCAVSACTAGEKSDEHPDAGPAPDALSAAIDGWTESNSGRFRFFLGDENDYLMATESAYLLDEDRVELGTVLRNGEQTTTVEAIRDRDQTWSRTAAGAEAPQGCWVRTPNGRTGPGGSDAFGSGASTTTVPQLAVLEQAKGIAWVEEGNVLTATTDLYALVSSLGQTWRQLDLDPNQGDRAEITVLLADDEVVAWRTDLGSVLEAARDAGAEVTPEMEQMIETGVEIQVLTGFSALGDEVQVARPPRKQVVDWAKDPATLERNLKACSA